MGIEYSLSRGRKSGLQEALGIAVEHHRAGRLQQAERIYGQILETHPKQADALHLLGMIKHQLGENRLAADLISESIEINPGFAEAHNNLGNVLNALGAPEAAIASYRQALEIDPANAQAHYNLANILRNQGKIEEAVACYRRALELASDFAEAHNNFGNVLRDQGKAEEAVASFRRALEINPKFAEAQNNLGNALWDQGEAEEAVACIRRALEINPKFAEAHNNLGNALSDQGEPEEAAACFRRALELDPKFAEAHNNLGNALKVQGKPEEAVACYRRAIEIDPEFAEVYHNLGTVLQGQGNLDEAVACCERALEVSPKFVEARFMLSAILRTLGRESEAREQLEEGIRQQPFMTDNHTSQDKPLTSVLKLSGLEFINLQLEDGKLAVNTGPIDTNLLLDSERFTVHQYFIFEDNLLNMTDNLPHFDIVLNAVVNPELETRSLDTARRFIARQDIPFINDPRKVAVTSREKICQMLTGVKNLVVPRTIREELAGRDTSLFMPIVEKHRLEFPLIVRPIGSHVGSCTVKIEDEKDFDNVIFSDRTMEFHITEFHDYRSSDGYFRKMRFFFVDGTVYPYHLAISKHWLVHHHTSQMKDHKWMRKEEEKFLENYQEYSNFSQENQAVLMEIYDKIGLDYFGFDCALLRNGNFLLFETNTAMIVRLDDPREIFPYKYIHVPKIVTAFQDMILSRVGG